MVDSFEVKRTLIRRVITGITAASTCLFFNPSVHANEGNIGEQEAKFGECLVQLKTVASDRGLSDYLVTDVLSQAKPIPKVIEYDRKQPEFVQTFPDYLNKRVNSWRINKGREMLAQHGDLLSKLYRQYGVPPHYLLAFWGLETNFGQYKGKMPIINALATLACDERRKRFFTEQLMLALELVEREHLDVDKMVGSWAGAMGHTQFMPSAYLAYAKDGDEDGKADLWESVPDALTSAANFLHHLGWNAGTRWGREVTLPENFDFSVSGKTNPQQLAYWNDLGLTQTSGAKVGTADIKASLLVPAGYQGPAFLVYSNFDVILRWNNSEFYGLAVGYLADRIIGGSPLKQPLPDLPNYSIDDVKALQNALNELGYEVGEADGIMGPATRKGIREFQTSKNLVADGFPSADTFVELQIPIS